MDTDRVKLEQIMPATGWYALYYFEGEPGEPNYDLSPLAAWALCNCKDGNDHYRAMKAVDFDSEGIADFADDSTNFIRYVHQSDLDTGKLTREEIARDATAWLAKKKK